MGCVGYRCDVCLCEETFLYPTNMRGGCSFGRRVTAIQVITNFLLLLYFNQ